MSITLKPREKSGIDFLEDTISAVNLISRANGIPQTELLFPVNSDGVTLAFKPGEFDYHSVWLEYSAILDDPTDENVEKAVEKAQREYEAWLAEGDHIYEKVISDEKEEFHQEQKYPVYEISSVKK